MNVEQFKFESLRFSFEKATKFILSSQITAKCGKILKHIAVITMVYYWTYNVYLTGYSTIEPINHTFYLCICTNFRAFTSKSFD